MKQLHHSFLILLCLAIILHAKCLTLTMLYPASSGLQHDLEITEQKIGSVEELGNGYLFIRDPQRVKELFQGSFSFSHRNCEKVQRPTFPSELPITFTHKQQKYEIRHIPKADSTKSKTAIAIIRNKKDTLGLFFDPGNHSGRYLRSFSQHKNDWALELRGSVIVNGEDLNTSKGYDESFGYSFFCGTPYYFYKKDGKIFISYSGISYVRNYEYIHHYACCEPYEYNPIVCKEHLNFFAIRNGEWYWVTITVGK